MIRPGQLIKNVGGAYGLVATTRLNGDQQMLTGWWLDGSRFDVLRESVSQAEDPRKEIERLTVELVELRESYTLTSRTLSSAQEGARRLDEYAKGLRNALEEKIDTLATRRWALKITHGDVAQAKKALRYLDKKRSK